MASTSDGWRGFRTGAWWLFIEQLINSRSLHIDRAVRQTEKQGACSKSRWRTMHAHSSHMQNIYIFILDCTRQQRKLLVLMCFVCLWIWLHWLDRQTFCTPFTPALSSSDTRQEGHMRCKRKAIHELQMHVNKESATQTCNVHTTCIGEICHI